MIQAIINDFQSIQEAKLKIDGVTLIIGESNQGKSACLRALQAACTNRFKAGQVRHGQDHALIRIKTPESPDVLSVLRSYSGGSPRMKLGQMEFSKLGRTLPKEVDEFLNLGQVDLNGEVFSCNFHPQFQKPLLLEFSQQKVMEILSASSALDDLKETKEQLMAERAKNKGAIQVVDSLIEKATLEVEEKKQEYSGLQPLVDAFTSKNSEYQALSEQLSDCDALISATTKHSKLIKKEELLNSFDITYVNYESQDDINFDATELEKALAKSAMLEAKENLLKEFTSKCDLNLDEKLGDVNRLIDLLESYNNCTQREAKAEAKVKLLEAAKNNQSEQSDISIKGYDIRELESKLSTYSMIITREKELVKIVDEHMCPICGHHVDM